MKLQHKKCDAWGGGVGLCDNNNYKYGGGFVKNYGGRCLEVTGKKAIIIYGIGRIPFAVDGP